MERILYVLGSGFTKAFSKNAPMVADILAALPDGPIREKAEEYQRLNLFDGPEKVVSLLIDSLYEATAEEALEKRNGLAVILRTIERLLNTVKADDEKEFTALVEEKFKCSGDREVDIATFNYDTLVEGYSKMWEYLPAISPNPFEAYSSAVRLTSYRRPVGLLKLHGSVNWYSHDSTLPSLSSTYFTKPGDQSRDQIRRSTLPVLVPFTFNRGYFLNGNLFSAIWKRMEMLMASADQIEIVGYGFPESDFYIFPRIIQHLSKISRVIVLDDAKDRLKGVFGDRLIIGNAKDVF